MNQPGRGGRGGDMEQMARELIIAMGAAVVNTNTAVGVLAAQLRNQRGGVVL